MKHSRSSPNPDQEFRNALAKPLKLFALGGSEELGASIAARLGCKLAAHEEREFEDGEHKSRPLEPVAGADVYVLHSLHGGPVQSSNDKLCRLLFFIGALKDAGAQRVTAVAPYLCYSRKDRRTKSFDPVTTRYIASMFEAVGTGTVVTLEVHDPAAFENAFRCRTVALTATPIFVEYVKTLAPVRLSVVSPDTGARNVPSCSEKRLRKSFSVPSEMPLWKSTAAAALSPARLSLAM